MTARMICKLYEIIENDPRFRKFKREIKYNPNCYKNYNTICSSRYNSQTKKFLEKKTNHDKEDNILCENETNEIQIQKNKYINENLNNSPNEIMKSTDSTMSTGNSDDFVEKKDEKNNILEKKMDGDFSDEIINEIFNDL